MNTHTAPNTCLQDLKAGRRSGNTHTATHTCLQDPKQVTGQHTATDTCLPDPKAGRRSGEHAYSNKYLPTRAKSRLPLRWTHLQQQTPTYKTRKQVAGQVTHIQQHIPAYKTRKQVASQVNKHTAPNTCLQGPKVGRWSGNAHTATHTCLQDLKAGHQSGEHTYSKKHLPTRPKSRSPARWTCIQQQTPAYKTQKQVAGHMNTHTAIHIWLQDPKAVCRSHEHTYSNTHLPTRPKTGR